MFIRFHLYRCAIVLCCVIITRTGYAQSSFIDTSAHRIGLWSGYLYAQSRDVLASPLKYSGGMLPLGLSYDYLGAGHRHHVSVAFRSSILESAITRGTDHSVEDVAGELTYTFLLKALSSADNRFTLYAGGTWSNSFAYREYTYVTSFDADETFGNLYSSLSLTGYGECELSERSRASVRLILPVVSFAVRPGYSSPSPAPEVEDDFEAILTGGRFASWESYRAFDLGLGYTYSLSSLFDFDVQYRLSYAYYDRPQPTATAIQALSIGLSLKI